LARERGSLTLRASKEPGAAQNYIWGNATMAELLTLGWSGTKRPTRRALAMVVALVAGLLAVRQRNRADDQRERAVAARIDAQLNQKAAEDARAEAERQARVATARGLAGQALAMVRPAAPAFTGMGGPEEPVTGTN